jgi:hypothetical protein
MFFGGIATVIAVPFTLHLVIPFIADSLYLRAFYTATLMSAGVCAVYIVFQLRRMFKTLLGGTPFVLQNVSCLRKCAVASALIALIFAVRLCMWVTISAALIVIIFSMLSLFSLTIKDLFKQAIIYKEETDWTV